VAERFKAPVLKTSPAHPSPSPDLPFDLISLTFLAIIRRNPAPQSLPMIARPVPIRVPSFLQIVA
jgi:hypothetical protein